MPAWREIESGMPRLRELQAKARERALKFHKLLDSPDGKDLMQLLRDEFYDGDLHDPDQTKLAMNLGARELVRYLLSLQHYNPNKE